MHSDVGVMLVECGLVDETQLRKALAAAAVQGGPVTYHLVHLGLVPADRMAVSLASILHLPLAEAAQFENLPAFITRLLPSDLVMLHRAIPIMLHQGVLHIAISDPTSRSAMEEISFVTGYQAKPVVAADDLIEKAMARYYGIAPEDRMPKVIDWKMRDIRPATAISPQPAVVVARESNQGSGEPFGTSPAFVPSMSEASDSPAAAVSSLEVGSQQSVHHREVLEPVSDELEELFGLKGQDVEVIHLTRRKGSSEAVGQGSTSGTTIADAVHRIEDESIPENASLKPVPEVFPAPPAGPSATAFSPPFSAQPEQRLVAATAITGQDASPIELEPLQDAELTRIAIDEARDRDRVASALVRFALSFLPRVALFIVKKDLLVGWMGAGQGLNSKLVRGIMIPLEPPSVFRTVRETGTDYFGSLPRSTVNDVFLSALSETRPKQVLLVPIAVRHKPIAILYGDCGQLPGFVSDLGPLHLMVQHASQAFESLILDKKLNRWVTR